MSARAAELHKIVQDFLRRVREHDPDATAWLYQALAEWRAKHGN